MNGPERPDTPDLSETGDADGLDELLRARVQGAAADLPVAPDAHAELVELTPRFRRARQRCQVAVAAMSSAAVVVLLVAGTLVFGGNDTTRIDTAGDDRRTSTTSTTVTTTEPTTTVTTVPTTVTADPPVTTTVPGDEGTSGGPGAGSFPTTTAAPTTTTTPPTTTTPVGGTQALTATGGFATVRWDADSITVLGTSPSFGWTLEGVEQESPTRVVVKFRRDEGGSGSSSSTIDARVRDGRLEVDS